jgi:hypothetical protein
MKKICKQCGTGFDTLYSDQLYCSGRCKNEAKSRRQGIKPRNKQPGDRYTRLVLVMRGPVDGSHKTWYCKCDCGTKDFLARADKLSKGLTKSCGCLQTENNANLALKSEVKRLQKEKNCQQQVEKDQLLRTEAETREETSRAKGRLVNGNRYTFHSWSGARSRCYNPRGISYFKYGGAGIQMSDRWVDSFENFLKDMGPRPLGKTLDRYPNKRGNYELGNCRWATPSQQSSNVDSPEHKERSSFFSKEAKEEREFIRSVAWG